VRDRTGYRKPSSACPSHDAQIREWAAAQVPLNEIARRVGANVRHVRRYLLESHIPHPVVDNPRPSYTGKGRPAGYIVPLSPCLLRDADIRRWAAEGLSLAEIGRRIGSKNQTVRAWLKRNQIPYGRKHSVGPNNPSWRGGRHIDKSGYVLVWMPDHPNARRGYVREHRLVMEKELGRLLEPQEIVHHKRGKQNNAPENLRLYKSNAEHLAEELLGKRPNWTPEGWAAMCSPRKRRRATTDHQPPNPGAASTRER